MKLEFSLTEARFNTESGAAVEISLLLQKLATLERLEKRGLKRQVPEWIDREKERQRENEREICKRQRDRAPDIARYNENMAATWKSRLALNKSLFKVSLSMCHRLLKRRCFFISQSLIVIKYYRSIIMNVELTKFLDTHKNNLLGHVRFFLQSIKKKSYHGKLIKFIFANFPWKLQRINTVQIFLIRMRSLIFTGVYWSERMSRESADCICR